MRLQDEIMEGVSVTNSPNLRDLMKEQDGEEIRVERPRQTMGSILSINEEEGRGFQEEGRGGKTLWEVIQEEEESKPKEGRILRNVLRFRFGREDSEVRDKEGEQRESESEAAEDEIRLLESWGAAERSPRSPAVVDSARLHMQDSRLARLESAAVRVYLVGGSNPAEDQTMDGINRRWRALKNRLRLRKFACCGSYWSGAAGAERSSFSNLSSTSVMPPPEEEEDDEEGEIGWNEDAGGEIHDQNPNNNPTNTTVSTAANATEAQNDTAMENAVEETCITEEETCITEERLAEPRRQQLITLFGRNFEPAAAEVAEDGSGAESRVGMNLAAALAAERQLRAAQEWGDLTARTSTSNSSPAGVSNLGGAGRGGTSPFRVSLMSLLEESSEDNTARSKDSEALLSEEWDSKDAGGVGEEPLCCVCMVRRKGAAFIPCGHTFCRLCTRELWVSRGSCPLCNRYIMEILDIF